MKYIVAMSLMMLGFAIMPAKAETAATKAVAEECQTNMATAAQTLGVDAQAYCKCVAERQSFHPEDFKDTSTPEGKRKIMESMTPCMEKYVKPSVFKMCDKANADSKNGGPSMDCGCFYGSLIETMTGSIASAESPDAVTQEQKAQMAQQAMVKCIKQ